MLEFLNQQKIFFQKTEDNSNYELNQNPEGFNENTFVTTFYHNKYVGDNIINSFG